jgi:hypothetical protein
MNKLLLISFLTFCTTAAFPQDSYIALNGQTVNGSVENNREWLKNPLSVVFTNSDGSKITLTPENCKSFTAGTDYYLSYHGTRVANPDHVLSSHNDEGAAIIKDTVDAFLRQVYKFDGYALYELYDNKRINFYLGTDGSIRELEYYETIKDGNVSPINSYKAYLYQQFASRKTSNFSEKLKDLHYNENDLHNFFAQVLGDQAHASEKLRNKYPSETLVGVGGNVNAGTMHSWTNYPYYHQTSIAPSVEFGLRLYSQRNFGKFFFQPTIGIMPLLNTFKGSAIATKTVKATIIDFSMGAGYMIIKKQNISVYAKGAAEMRLFAGYKTKDGKYLGDDGSNGRITGVAELGLIIKRNLNIAFNNTFPVRMTFKANTNYSYKLSGMSLALRYAFIHGSKK